MMILKIHYHIIICLIQPLILGLIYKVDTLNSKIPDEQNLADFNSLLKAIIKHETSEGKRYRVI